jgi:hypothetical protein
MRKNLGSTLAVLLAIASNGGAMAQTQTLEQKIWALLDDPKPAYVSLGEGEFRALGASFDLPDGGTAITRLAEQALGGAFDPRDVAKIAPQQLGYKADWVVERFRRYNLDWDIAGLRLESLDPKNYPWFIVMNGGAANFYEFFVDLKNRPGWAQYLAQKLNVMIVTIPGNFKYGGWEQPVVDLKRQPAYLLDRDLSMDEYEVRNAIFTNSLIMQGLKALVTRHTSGDILLIGHSTSGELSMLAYEDSELGARLKGRYLGWGSGGPARLELLRTVRGKEVADRAGASPPGGRTPLHVLERRDPPSYSRGYSGFLNPLYEPGMSHLQIAERWLAAEARRRPNFKQQLQNFEHGADLGQKGWVENEIESLLKRTGNPWHIEGFVCHQFHPHGRISAHGLDDGAFRPQSLESRTAHEEHRGVRRQRVPGEKSRRADPADQLGSADDALRPLGAAETARGGAFQCGALAGEAVRSADMPWLAKSRCNIV